MRSPVRVTEARRGIAESSQDEMLRGWGDRAAGQARDKWPPLDWSLSTGVAQGTSHEEPRSTLQPRQDETHWR